MVEAGGGWDERAVEWFGDSSSLDVRCARLVVWTFVGVPLCIFGGGEGWGAMDNSTSSSGATGSLCVGETGSCSAPSQAAASLSVLPSYSSFRTLSKT